MSNEYDRPQLLQERGNAYVQHVASEARGTSSRLVGFSQTEMVDEVMQLQVKGEEEERMPAHVQSLAPPKKEEEEAAA